ncbi:MAG: hypothetical protein GY861_19095 [bacterium]|nr:hypothetical protein [bacterium]
MDIEEDTGNTLPPLQEEPDLNDCVVPYWRAFTTLAPSRQAGMGLGYIPYSEIICYLNENDIFDQEERARMLNVVQFIDSEYVILKNTKAQGSGALKTNVKGK